MPADAVDEIKARLDIVEIIGGYVRLQKSGRDYKGLCPFHAEKTPSFAVSQEKQVWYCFPCQDGGDVIRFVERAEHIDFRAALELLAERAGVELTAAAGQARGGARLRRRIVELNERALAFFSHVLWSRPEGASGREFLERRGVPEDVARQMCIGAAPAGGPGNDSLSRYLMSRGAKATEVVDAGLAHASGRGSVLRDRFRGRLVFPIRDERGATVGFGGRALDGASAAGPKYLNTPETAAFHKSRALFGLDSAREHIAAYGEAVLVEGYFDVIAGHVGGVPNVIAASGTAFTAEQLKLVARYCSRVVLCFDSDEAGWHAVQRAVDLLAANGIAARIAVLPDGVKDPGELLLLDPAIFKTRVSTAEAEWQVLLDRALLEGEGGSVEARRAAAERAVRLLVSIPVAATRDLYVQQAAHRLGLQPKSLEADISAARASAVARHSRPIVRLTSLDAAAVPIGPVPSRDADPVDDAAASEAMPSPAETLLGSLVVQRPELAAVLVNESGLALEVVSHVGIRRIIEAALEVPAGEALALHRLAASDQRLAARLLLRVVPEVDESSDVVRRAIGDAAILVREARHKADFARLRREIASARHEGRRQDEADLVARLHGLAEGSPHLRRHRDAP